jgi:hypothetical protein
LRHGSRILFRSSDPTELSSLLRKLSTTITFSRVCHFPLDIDHEVFQQHHRRFFHTTTVDCCMLQRAQLNSFRNTPPMRDIFSRHLVGCIRVPELFSNRVKQLFRLFHYSSSRYSISLNNKKCVFTL